ncbi:MAG: arginine repressor [Phycisphaeraceae bacterium]|nr:MAG: arginine repressor [Phycisphaeraceae bacterium]
MPTPLKRQALIREILAEGPVSSQDRLGELLLGRGVRATQATLSRDLRELGVVKGPEGYRLPMEPMRRRLRGLAATGALERVIRQYVVGMDEALGLIVMRTGPGHAQVVALELDRTPPEGLAGTIAGDDTMFLAPKTEADLRALAVMMREMAGLEVTP